VKKGYIDTLEGQVHYRIEGCGEPLLLLHKAGFSSDEFTDMLPFLGKNYRAIAMDMLGYGNTELPRQELEFDDYVQNIIHFLDAMKIDKADIAGHLLGSSFAVEIAATHPERVNKLILWDAIYLTPEVRKETQEQYQGEHMELKPDGSHLFKLWKSKGPKAPDNLQTVQRSVVEYLKSSLGAATGVSHRALFTYDIAPKLSKIKCPTLLLCSRGPLFDRQGAIKKLIPTCRIKILESNGSFLFWEKPEEIAQVFNDFFK
jgi:pimeloyl-ACP methyl ester carboxylesterase